ncbi:PAS domain S-box protein [Hyalangium rubrum]|uniref:histidine kinase n=1 Tax=Hyalangium rubrum TaxID=3103134 RepID=A0ABU5GW58_9BACT|nr:PAS domain S-box protein [Hyalangium sp. s54d21]MDY7225428.1 PAS domain S-box protein [Hyalangium sp. s54d21]
MRTGHAHAGPPTRPVAIHWEANAETLRCLSVDEHARRLGFPRERWLREEGFLARTVFAPDQDVFLHGCRAAAKGVKVEDCYRTRAADGRSHVFGLTLEVKRQGHERRLRGRMVECPPEATLQPTKSPLIVAYFDRQQRHLYVNRGVVGVTGLPPALFIGRTNAELGMPSRLVQLWRAECQRVFQREEALAFEFEFPALDAVSIEGSTLFQAHLTPVFDHQGRIRSVRCETYRLASSQRRYTSTQALPPPAADQRLRGVALLGQLHKGLGTASGRKDVLRALGQLVGTELGDWCDVDLLNGEVLEHVASFGQPGGTAPSPPGEVPAPLAWRVSLTGISELLAGPSEQVAASLAPDQARLLAFREAGLLDCLAVPLRLGERTLGVLTFATRDPAARFDTDTLALAESVAGLAAWAFEVHQLRQGEHVSRGRIQHFQRVVAALGEARQPSQVADVVMGEVSRALCARTAVVYRLDPSGQALEMLASRGGTEAGPRCFVRLPLNFSAPITDALKQRESIWLDSPATFRRLYPMLARRASFAPPGALCAVPLLLEGRALGVLALGFETSRDFSEAEQAFALAVARQCAQALERTRLFESLEQAWQGLDAILDAAPLALLVLDGDGTVRRWNPAATRIFGWSAEEAVGHFLPTTPPEARDELLTHLRAASRGERAPARERRHLCKQGQPIDVVYWLSSLVDASGQRRCIYIAADDTLRKEAERRADGLTHELQRQVAEFQTLLNVVPAGIAIAREPQCQRIQANAWLTQLLDLPEGTNLSLSAPEAERVQGMRFLRRGRELRAEELPMQRAAATGEEVLDVTLDVELRGRRFTLLTSTVPLFDEEHKPRGVIASFLDITSRTRAMEAQHFLAECSAALSSTLDQEQTFQMLARLCIPGLASMAMLFGSKADGTLGLLSTAHADPELERLLVRRGQHLRATDEKLLREVLRTGRPRLIPTLDEPGLGEAGDDPERRLIRERLALRSAMLIPICSQQRVTNVLVLGSSERTYTCDDCTFAQEFAAHAASALDNARLYREAREAVALRDEFLGIAGHELRTPLTALKLGLQSLSREGVAVGQHERLTKWINHCQRQGERLGRLVNDLLDVGLITSGRMPLVCEELDLSALVEEVVARLRPELELAGCPVSLRLESPLMGSWDRSRLEQVLTNLLSNAAKYGNSRPIQVHASALPGDRVRLSVRDEGIGISPEDQARIFGRFERAVSERHYGGLGLGLWITQQIVRRFGGHIGVASAREQGSTFTVDLPRYVEVEAPEALRRGARSRPSLEQAATAETLARAEGEPLYRSILTALWEGIVVQSRDGNILTANASAEHILGLSVDEMTGRTSMDPRWRAIHEDGSDFPGSEHPSMEALRTGKPVRSVFMGVQRPDGSRVWLIVNAQPLQRPGEPAPYMVVTSFFDVTELRRVPPQVLPVPSEAP